MSLYESDSALLTQTNHSWLHSAAANFGKRLVREISWYDNHREHGLGSTYLWSFVQSISFEGTRLSHLGVLRRLQAKLWYALNWSMQHPFGGLIVKLRFSKWRRYRGRQPTGPAGGGATLVVLERCLMGCNGQLWMLGGISPLCFSSTRFIVGLCLLIKTSTWPRLRVQDLPGHHTTHSIAGPRLIMMPWSILFSQGLFPIGIVWLHLWSQLRPQRRSGNSFKWPNQNSKTLISDKDHIWSPDR